MYNLFTDLPTIIREGQDGYLSYCLTEKMGGIFVSLCGYWVESMFYFLIQ
jgi:hypothetical protein